MTPAPLIPEALKAYFARTFPRFDPSASGGEMQVEDQAGVGLGITACILLMVALRYWVGASRPDLVITAKKRFLPIFLGTLVALGAFLARFGNEGAPRYLTPYYPLLIAGLLILLGLNGAVIRFRACKILACIVMCMAIPLILLSPQRPLFPTKIAVQLLAKVSPASAARMQVVYEIYGTRNNSLEYLLAAIPKTETSVGFIQTGDLPEAVLWLPYGSRHIVDVEPAETIDQLKAAHISYIIVDDEAVTYKYHTTLDMVIQKWLAAIVLEKHLTLWASRDPEPWHVIKLQ